MNVSHHRIILGAALALVALLSRSPSGSGTSPNSAGPEVAPLANRATLVASPAALPKRP